MKFIVNAEQLRKFNIVVSVIAKGVDQRSSIPAFQMIKLDVKAGKGLTFTSQNSEYGISMRLKDNKDCTTFSDGSVLLPAKLFLNMIKKIKATDELTIESDDTITTTIKFGKSSYELNTMDSSNFPKPKEVEKGQSDFEMDAAEMRNLIHNTLFSAADSQGREILQGVHLIIKPDSIKAIGTDSHRLSSFEIQKNTGVKEKIDTTLSVNTLKFIQTLLPYVKSKLQLSSNHDQFILKIGDEIKFVSTTIEGEYPQVDALIPQDETTKFSVDTESFMEFIDRVRFISHSGENNVVTFNIDPAEKSISLSSNANTYGNCQQDVTSIDIDGDKLEISANPDYLYEILRVYKQDGIDEVAFSFTKPLRPFLVNPLTDKQSEIINLVTPIKVY